MENIQVCLGTVYSGTRFWAGLYSRQFTRNDSWKQPLWEIGWSRWAEREVNTVSSDNSLVGFGHDLDLGKDAGPSHWIQTVPGWKCNLGWGSSQLPSGLCSERDSAMICKQPTLLVNECLRPDSLSRCWLHPHSFALCNNLPQLGL